MPLSIKRTCESYELRGARVVQAKADYPCDLHDCPNQTVIQGSVDDPAIKRGDWYALTSTKLRICAAHLNPEDVTDE